MVIGSNGGAQKNIKAELFDFGTGGWTELGDYPYADRDNYFSYAMVYIDDLSAYIVVAGYVFGNIKTIGMFKNGVWSQAGQLNTARNVIFCLFCLLQINCFNLRHIKLNGLMEL